MEECEVLHVTPLCLGHAACDILGNSQGGLTNKLQVNVCLPQQEENRIVVVNPDLLSRPWKFVRFLWCCFMHSSTVSSVALTLLSRKAKPASNDESTLHSFPSLTVLVALVVEVLGNQLVQLLVGGWLRYVAGYPLLDLLQYHLVVVNTSQGGTFSPQPNVVVWGSLGLVPLLIEVVRHLTKHLTFQSDDIEKVVKLLRELM